MREQGQVLRQLRQRAGEMRQRKGTERETWRPTTCSQYIHGGSGHTTGPYAREKMRSRKSVTERVGAGPRLLFAQRDAAAAVRGDL